MAEPSKPAPKPRGGAATGSRGPRRVTIADATFTTSIDAPDGHPEGPPEIAIAGRSNVGKSSLINAVCVRRALARTSRTPGRTQRVNLFDMRLIPGGELRLVDLPGYGHARVPRAVRDTFGPMIERYLLGRRSLRAVALLVDARRDPDEDSINFALWLNAQGLHVEVIVTKVDKVPRNRRAAMLEGLRVAFSLAKRPIATSASTSEGIDELRRKIGQIAARPERAHLDAVPK